jgi:hypothetical protein
VFARLYLIARSVTLHSPLVDAASSRTIGYLNRVPITISFTLRAFLQTYPAGCWSCVMMTILLIASWSMHACEKGMWMPITSSQSLPTTSTSTFINATWLTIVTFTTVGQFSLSDRFLFDNSVLLGYGDITPQTYCGRGKIKEIDLNRVFLVECFRCFRVDCFLRSFCIGYFDRSLHK